MNYKYDRFQPCKYLFETIMFEKIVLRRSENGPALSIGELAEALLFYQNVHIVLDHGSFNGLVSKIGMSTLLSLLSRPNISAVYCEETLGTKTEDKGHYKSHSFVTITFAGNKDIGKLPNRKKRLEYLLSRHGYSKRQSKRFVERFRKHVPIRKLSDDHFIKEGIVRAAWGDLYEPDFIQEAIRHALIYMLGSELLPSEFYFKVYPTPPSFHIDTNLNFETINKELKQRDPTLNDVNEALLINNILMARADIVLSAFYGGEFYTSDLTSEIIRLKYGELLKRIGIEKQELKEFSEIIIHDGPSIREVINSGERTFDEFLLLLDKSQQFKDWAQGVNPDEKLVKAYFENITSEGWIKKLPGKMLRYFVGALIGIANPLAGLSVSAADSLFIEKILNGWRPSHFINQKLKPFLNIDEQN